jgi:hypothetical protein
LSKGKQIVKPARKSRFYFFMKGHQNLPWLKEAGNENTTGFFYGDDSWVASSVVSFPQ